MAWAVWFTGLPGCGKTTIARRTKEHLSRMGVEAMILELDEIRKVITPNPRYTDEERDIVYASLAYMAKLLCDAGVNVIIDATANRRRYRDLARELVKNFAEVYIKAPLELCIEREASRKAEFAPRGIYRKAASGARVPGVGVEYEEPMSPEIVVDTTTMDPDSAAEFVSRRILELFAV
ncbi:MAG: adenylyl-sulfate kinase [Methanothrix sp.]|jgi:adenylylsulfate kinase|uniref:adenylyl-sulfate kinase n=1 Tax=Methanothrix sp. TaxID=90426 RepID=UPI00247C467D|nr:adenylyl-sulfate kinase [Methanothrix sp.]